MFLVFPRLQVVGTVSLTEHGAQLHSEQTVHPVTAALPSPAERRGGSV